MYIWMQKSIKSYLPYSENAQLSSHECSHTSKDDHSCLTQKYLFISQSITHSLNLGLVKKPFYGDLHIYQVECTLKKVCFKNNLFVFFNRDKLDLKYRKGVIF